MDAAVQPLIHDLAVPHRARQAFWRLMAIGPAALPAVREGLRHESAAVRDYCCRFLDHFLEPPALTELIAMLDDPDPGVRGRAMHSLTCDRCKEGECRPDERLVLSVALKMLADDPDAHVRAHAAGVVGLSVHARPEAEAALLAVAQKDPSPAVRKKARWYLPGGPIWRRTAPRPPRRSRA